MSDTGHICKCDVPAAARAPGTGHMPVPRGQSATIRVRTAVFQYVATADDNPWSFDRGGATLPADHGKAAYHFSPAQRLAEASADRDALIGLLLVPLAGKPPQSQSGRPDHF